MPSTSDINLINLQVMAEDQIAIDRANGTYDANRASDSKYYLWHSEFQTIPMGMDGNPEQFAQRLREAVPLVNTLRLAFNEHSFNPDGSLNEQYERFLHAAVAEGFEILFVYAGGGIQRAGDTATSSDDLYAAIEGEIFDGMHDGWASMVAWLGDNIAVRDALYGLEIANEPESYSVGGDMDGTGSDRFVELYGAHVIEIAAMLDAAVDTNLLVGGWRYSARFDELDVGDLGGQTVLNAIRAAVGEDLVWSSHFFPGWLGSNRVHTIAELEALLTDHYAILGEDSVLITETNASGTLVDNIDEAASPAFLFARTYEWFAQNGIGLGWFPGAESGGSNFVVIDANGGLRFLHQSSIAHGLNGFSLDEAPAQHAAGEALHTILVAGRIRNEPYQPEGLTFDETDGIAYGFGYGGDDTITGQDTANDLIYGGAGRDRMFGGGNDDHLFGQAGDDLMMGGSGDDHLFGGDGNDFLSAGTGFDQMTGGSGADTFAGGAGHLDIVDFNMAEGDRFELDGAAMGTLAILSSASVEGASLILDFGTGSVTLHDFIIMNADAVLQALYGDDAGTANAVTGTEESDLIVAGYSNGVGSGPSAGSDVILAGGGSDRLEGADGADVLIGGAGTDTLVGGAGDDILVGGTGSDWIEGGAGNDLIVLGHLDDSFYFTSPPASGAQALTNPTGSGQNIALHDTDSTSVDGFHFVPADPEGLL